MSLSLSFPVYTMETKIFLTYFLSIVERIR